ncbi:hypothetical protein [Ruminococcus sp. AM31-15AC]|uniref:hypothetical protein n=1 Tax=Ruminococcus sp. AM31-15AC TaxID=2293202 RepID=UPI000E50F551|nr:hypothetical protein DW793_08305 [Ruminococcus sp. AM31-15AC]
MSKNNNNNEEKLSAKEKREIIKRTLKAVRVADSGYLIRDTIEYVLGLPRNLSLYICLPCYRRDYAVKTCWNAAFLCGDSCWRAGCDIYDKDVSF